MYATYFASSPTHYLFTKDQLATFSSERGGRVILLAIVGEVYDVSKSPDFYGKGGGYAFFTGRDASRAYITGDFEGDLTDDVADFTDDQMAGLVKWKQFYLKEYTYKGRLTGAFFDSDGVPTDLLREVVQANARSKAAAKLREGQRAAHPNCNRRWSQNSGSEVWCDDGMYPRRLTEMVNGAAEQRCACFNVTSWSNTRQIYEGCDLKAHRCKLQTASSTAGSSEKGSA